MIGFLKRHGQLNWVLLDQGLVSGSNFILGILLARTLGVAGFGIYSIGWMAVLLGKTVQTALVISPMLTLGPFEEGAGRRSYYASATFLQVGFAIVFGVVLYLAAYLGGPVFSGWPAAEIALPLAVAGALHSIQDFFRRAHISLQGAAAAFSQDIIAYLGLVAALVAMALLDAGLNPALVFWWLAVTSLVSAIWGFWQMRQALGGWGHSSPKRTLKRHVGFGGWLLGNGLLQWSGSQGVLFLAGAILGPTSVGAARVVINLVAPVNIVMQALQNFLPVRASLAFAKSGARGLDVFLGKALLYTVGTVTVMAVVVVLFRQPLMQAFYGSAYAQHANLVIWQGGYVVLGAVVAPLTVYFKTVQRTFVLAAGAVLAAPVAIAVAFLTLDFWGENGIFAGLVANAGILVLALVFFYGLVRRQQESPKSSENEMPHA